MPQDSETDEVSLSLYDRSDSDSLTAGPGRLLYQ